MAKPLEKINLQLSHVRLYQFVEKYVNKHIVSPQMDEIAKGIELTLRQTYRLVDDLCTLGYLEKDTYKRRSLRILKPLR